MSTDENYGILITVYNIGDMARSYERNPDGFYGFRLFLPPSDWGIFIFEDGGTFVNVRWWW